MTNQAYGALLSRDEDFKVFDTFSPELREAVRNAPTNVSCADIRAFKRKWGFEDHEVIPALEERLRSFTAADARKTYGRNHPQSDDACPWPLYLEKRHAR